MNSAWRFLAYLHPYTINDCIICIVGLSLLPFYHICSAILSSSTFPSNRFLLLLQFTLCACMHVCARVCARTWASSRFFMRNVGISESWQFPVFIILTHSDVSLSHVTRQNFFPLCLVWWCLQVFYPGARLEWKYPGYPVLAPFLSLSVAYFLILPVSPGAVQGHSANACVSCCGGKRMPLGFCFSCSGFYSLLVQGGLLKNPVLQFFSCTEKEAKTQENKWPA